MADLEYSQPHKILAYQEVNFGTEVVRRAVLVRSELAEESDINLCPSVYLQRYNQSNIIGYGQCRRDSPLITHSGKTVLCEVFWVKSVTFPRKIWVHRRLLGAEADAISHKLLTKHNVFILYPSLKTEILKPVFKNSAMALTQHSKNAKNTRPMPLIREVPIHQAKKTQVTQMIKPPKPVTIVKEPTLPKQRYIGDAVTLDLIKYIFAIGSDSLGQSVGLKFCMEKAFPTYKEFPIITPTFDIENYVTEVLKMINATYPKPENYFFCSLFLFSVEIAQIRREWMYRFDQLDDFKRLIFNMRKHFEMVSFVFTQPMFTLCQIIFERYFINENVDIQYLLLQISEPFVWGQMEVRKLQYSYRLTPLPMNPFCQH
ncbi:hypothetical protein EIN_152920 [Entamoeba invadens IP1]|uniref:Uncharacterized protein n=1 Tax=Entamoeba invadens IP1 TaxID=370355 RepID=A0A0A1U8P4_ENTIV|nr:hypothetical protein EIN_152920 [Entamoeba invadens IP1]ELP91295.1 hypothetical protein EIN_152920 [Entamoeba invadens IP1]|eukprot:XP_004258066.1 hypothetical protein EIN_152920 [Entamoeba invadens IP1]